MGTNEKKWLFHMLSPSYLLNCFCIWQILFFLLVNACKVSLIQTTSVSIPLKVYSWFLSGEKVIWWQKDFKRSGMHCTNIYSRLYRRVMKTAKVCYHLVLVISAHLYHLHQSQCRRHPLWHLHRLRAHQ